MKHCLDIHAAAATEPAVGSLTFQHFLLIVSAVLTIVNLLLTVWLVLKHLFNYVVPDQQRQIVRLAWTPLVFGILSVISIAKYSAAEYMDPLEDVYESFAFAALFLLFVQYVCPGKASREQYFYNLESTKRNGQVVPGGSLKWFNRRWVLIFQFFVVQVIFLPLTAISTARSSNCRNTSMSPRHLHFWIVVIPRLSTILAAIGIITFYRRLKREMAGHKPLLKMLSFKFIVLVNLIQGLLFNILTAAGTLDGSVKVRAVDLQLGLPAFLLAVEAFLLICFFHYSFRTSEYAVKDQAESVKIGPMAAALDTFNPDMLRAIFHAFRLVFTGKIFRSGPPEPSPYKVQTESRIPAIGA